MNRKKPAIPLAQIKKLNQAKDKQEKIQKRELAEKRKREEEEKKRAEAEKKRKILEDEQKAIKKLLSKKQEKINKQEKEERARKAAARALLAAGNVEIAAFSTTKPQDKKDKINKQKKSQQDATNEKDSNEADDSWEDLIKDEIEEINATTETKAVEGGTESSEMQETADNKEEIEEGGNNEEEEGEDWETEMERKEKEKEKEAEKNEDENEQESDSDSDDDEEESESTEDDSEEAIMRRHEKRMKRRIEKTIKLLTDQSTATSSSSQSSKSAKDEESEPPLHAPIVCILGHVDVGKTKILDKLRQTNIQAGEAGGITQQIGATFFPMENIRPTINQIASVIPPTNYDKLPGLLIIDTPGHESFTNLRQRGSALCNLAILVVDIMHSLEPQTLESLEMIRRQNCPFVIALNKIDRVTSWKAPEKGETNLSFVESYKRQTEDGKRFFNDRLEKVVNDLAGQGINAALYNDTAEHMDFSDDYVRIIPTSAHTGEGLPDLLANLLSIGQMEMSDLLHLKPELEATVMEVKTLPGLGTTLDVILANGTLSVGDTIVVGGTEGPIRSVVRQLLTPHPMKEMRVKDEYILHQHIRASIGVKICGPDLDNALAGSPLFVAYDDEEIEVLEDMQRESFESILSQFVRNDTGVYVMASTVGSLEALVTFIDGVKPPVPIAAVSIGTVHKKDVVRASIMVEKDPKYSVILAFDVGVDADARLEAEENGVTIFTSDTVYRLVEKFTNYLEELHEQEGEDLKKKIVYPAKLQVLQCIHESDPVIIGVRVVTGKLRLNAPLVGIVKEKDHAKMIEFGILASMERDKQPLQVAEAGAEVAIRIARGAHPVPIYGKQFDTKTILSTKFDRTSIDYIKEYERDELTKDLKKFIAEMKGPLAIPEPDKK